MTPPVATATPSSELKTFATVVLSDARFGWERLTVTWKQQLISKAFTLMQDPRVAKLLQDPRVMSSLMQAMKLRTDVERSFNQRVKQLAKTLRLASEDEVQELQRAVARLEQELERARNQQHRRDVADGRKSL